MLILDNEHLRRYLWHPKGVVYRGRELEKLLNETRGDIIATIGDYVTARYIDITGEPPNLAFIDRKTLRKESSKYTYNQIISSYKNIFRISSPPGSIPIEIIRERLSEIPALIASDEKALVLVEGEEDLAVFLVPYLLPSGRRYWIIYGQPGLGSVVLPSDYVFYTMVSTVLSRMRLQISSHIH